MVPRATTCLAVWVWVRHRGLPAAQHGCREAFASFTSGGGAPSHSYSAGCTRTNGNGQLGTAGKTVTCYSTGAGGTNGGGGSSGGSHAGGAGAGLTGHGANGKAHCDTPGGGTSFTNGGNGGSNSGCYGASHGGFGGGGAGELGSPGGAGGYSGGGAAGSWASYADYGGGGGSYNAGTDQDNASGVNTGDGQVTITFINAATPPSR